MAKENVQKKQRPPVVVVMGHVDHGKTTLLDCIRKTNTVARAIGDPLRQGRREASKSRPVAGREAGGITQSIGAYEIVHATDSTATPNKGEHSSGRKITFIDTPGHEAFTAMRAHGVHAADLAILVVAADEGVKPQTKESIKNLKETKTPFIVAINKIDRPGANPDKVKNELAEAEVLLEGRGGDVSFQEISAKEGTGVDALLDLLVLASDLEELTYDPSAPASGYVLEVHIDRRRGSAVTVIVTNGVLRRGDIIHTPSSHGKIRILEDFTGKTVAKVTPSAPALVVGFEELPNVGEKFTVGEVHLDTPTEIHPAPPPERELAERAALAEAYPPKADPLSAESKLEETASTEAEKQEVALPVVLKASDSGSLEALAHIIKGMETDVPITIMGESVGEIFESDVKTAIPSRAYIVGFKTKIDKSAKTLAENQSITIITSHVIYDIVTALEEVLKTFRKQKSIGTLEVLAIFDQSRRDAQTIGGRVVEGTFRNHATFEIHRGATTIGTGKVANLQCERKNIGEVPETKECGLLVNAEMIIKKRDTLVITSA